MVLPSPLRFLVVVAIISPYQVTLGQRFHLEPPTLGSCSAYRKGQAITNEPFQTFCYIALWYTEVHFGSFTGSTLDPFLCTHIVVGYYDISRRNWDIILPTSPLHIELIQKVHKLKILNPNLRILIAIGGYTDNRDDPEKYVQLAKVEENTQTFASNVVKFLSANRVIDGIDFQWNYPGRHRISNPDDDRELLGVFTERLCNRLRKKRFICMATLQRPKHNIVNMTKTLHAFAKIINVADFVHIWTADIPPEVTAFQEMYHSDLLFRPPQGTYLYGNNSEYTVEALITFFTNQVLHENDMKNRKKLLLTIPMQANSFQLAAYKWRDLWPKVLTARDPRFIPKPPNLGENTHTGYETGLEQYPFFEICHRTYLLPVSDPKKLFVYSHYTQNGTDSTPVAYSESFLVPTNTPQAVRDKVKYAKEMQLGGVSIFQLGADDVKGWCYNQTYPLLNAVFEETNNCD